MKHLAYLNKYLYKYRWRLIPGFIFVVISNYFGVLPAQVIRIAFDLVKENIGLYQLFAGFDRQALVYQVFGYSLLLFGALVLLLALIRGLFLFLMRQTIILTSRHIEYDLKNEIYSHYQKLDMAFFRANNTGDLMNRVTEDVSRVRGYLGPALMHSVNILVIFVMVITAMFNVNAHLAVYALLPIPILSIIVLYVNKIINQRSQVIQERLSSMSSFVQETFSGIRVIKSYNRESNKQNAFEEESVAYKDASISLIKVQAFFFPLIVLLTGLSTVITIYIGGIEVMKGSITSGNIAEFIVYVNQLTFPVMSIAWITSLVQRAAASQKRINEFLKTTPTILSPTTADFKLQGHLEFQEVSFTYPNTGITALKNVSFHVKPDQLLAVIGRTGSGKSTIARLLMRMYDTDEGKVMIDGQDIKTINLHDYRSQVGFVPQEVFLFSDTIGRNIAFGLDTLDMAVVEKAAKQAALYENIMRFEHQFETEIGERGLTLSGGQKQRLSIARALAIQPQVLVFDDCLSAVDTKTEEEILQNLRPVLRGKSALFIAHRISSIKNADHILLLDKESIIEQGTHDDLIAQGGAYFDLYQKQLLEEQES
ncbi:ABC transporter ATP-binding protein [Olivibacter sitiensis]|uniref:ABC transporter ATP-binding protein n=1 Tax=Olivibacter sitiensis TaxID=376470 RepID=UPI0004188995|nr:ABC transporter ATP-binding protein [Olivibacter sitiensis]